jgi:type VI protein secretion system component VasK
MSINGISASNGSMLYSYLNNLKKSGSSDSDESSLLQTALSTASSTSSSTSIGSGSYESGLAANEAGVRARMPAPPEEDNGFSQSQLSEMASDDSPMSELFSALADNFDEADMDSDGVITRDEAMSFAEANDIDVPPPPGGQGPAAMAEQGLTQGQLSEMSSEDSPMSSLFSALAENFDEADANEDGVVSQAEAMAYAKDNDIAMPAPPQGGGAMSDAGLTQKQLSDMASEESPLSDLFSALADNFEDADADGDGVVTQSEVMEYAKLNDMSYLEREPALSVSA